MNRFDFFLLLNCILLPEGLVSNVTIWRLWFSIEVGQKMFLSPSKSHQGHKSLCLTCKTCTCSGNKEKVVTYERHHQNLVPSFGDQLVTEAFVDQFFFDSTGNLVIAFLIILNLFCVKENIINSDYISRRRTTTHLELFIWIMIPTFTRTWND